MISAGIDVGTRFVKVCIVDDQRLIGHSCLETGKNMRRIIKEAYKRALKAADIKKRRVEVLSATGFGAELVKKAGRRIPEAPCIAKAVSAMGQDVRVAVDVGGLFINVVVINSKGLAEDFFTNDRCAAGSGKFLEMVSNAVETPFQSISDYASGARHPYAIQSSCAVFAESEIVSQLNTGQAGDEIMAGVLGSIASRAATLLGRTDGAGKVALCGGVARIAAFRTMFQDLVDRQVFFPAVDHQLVTAYGAALAGKR